MAKITTERILSLRELNRATLARQMLLERAPVSATDAIERLVGLQAQVPQPPYVGLWTRVRDFRRDDLAQRILNRDVIKATLMRATLHLFTARDYRLLRSTLQPVLTQAFQSIAKRRAGAPFALDQVLDSAREYIAAQPRTFEDISAMLTERFPGCDVGAMRYGVRMHLPLIVTPIEDAWSYPGNPAFTLAESWLGEPVPTRADLQALVRRYLAAFGPATVTDLQKWSGLARLRDEVEKMKPDLRNYRDEQGRELLDLPDMPLPAPETPAPERFLPEFDNLLLGHEKRTRIIADRHHAGVFLTGLRVRATILVDGFVRGAWKVEKTKTAASLVIEPFDTLTRQNRRALTEEAEQLVRFVEPNMKTYEVRFTEM